MAGAQEEGQEESACCYLQSVVVQEVRQAIEARVAVRQAEASACCSFQRAIHEAWRATEQAVVVQLVEAEPQAFVNVPE